MPAIAPDVFSGQGILQQFKVRFRRSRREGFGGFLLSISLFTLAAILIRTYLHDRTALEDAVRNQILSTVGTSEEPADSATELGLIASALAKVNAKLAAQSWDCQPANDLACGAIEELPELFAAEVKKVLAAGQEQDQSRTGRPPDLDKLPAPEPGRPICISPDLDEKTYLVIPAQVRGSDGKFPDSVVEAKEISGALDSALARLEADFRKREQWPIEHFVQAYFISPDSLLRIWTSRGTNVCSEFNKPRLWAAKSYFAYFLDHPTEDTNSTLAYIDYGGNGLVRTHCHALYGKSGVYDSPVLKGALCMDLKLPDGQLAYMRRNLFFETALVTFNLPYDGDPEHTSVEIEYPDVSYPNPNIQPNASKRVNGAKVAGNLMEAPEPAQGEPFISRSNDEIAIGMQESPLSKEDIQNALRDRLGGVAPNSLRRDITHIPIRGKEAFLLPLGFADGSFHGLVFYPRNPELNFWDNFAGVLGFIFAGAALLSAGYSWRIRPKAAELRDRLALFRNLQVGIVRVDQDDWILESNDRAEELFQRKLPKPEVEGLRINFHHLIELRVREVVGWPKVDQPNANRYEVITAKSVSKMRARGQWSAYYALLPEGKDPRWLRVSATPTMAHMGGQKTSGIQLLGVFATISEVASETASDLDQFLDRMATKGEPK